MRTVLHSGLRATEDTNLKEIRMSLSLTAAERNTKRKVGQSVLCPERSLVVRVCYRGLWDFPSILSLEVNIPNPSKAASDKTSEALDSITRGSGRFDAIVYEDSGTYSS